MTLCSDSDGNAPVKERFCALTPQAITGRLCSGRLKKGYCMYELNVRVCLYVCVYVCVCVRGCVRVMFFLYIFFLCVRVCVCELM